MEGERGNPLYLGRTTNQLNRRQRRALKLRDGCCRFPGCTNTLRVNGHHVAWWERDFGPTNIDNLVSLCPHHHRLIHQRKFFVQIGVDGEFVFTRPDSTTLDPAPALPEPAATRQEANAAVGVEVAGSPAPGDGGRFDLDLTITALVSNYEAALRREGA